METGSDVDQVLDATRMRLYTRALLANTAELGHRPLVSKMTSTGGTGMDIAVIGCGNMGSGLARNLALHHTVWIGEQDEQLGKQRAIEVGAAGGGKTDQMPTGIEVIFITLRWWNVDEALGDLKGAAGKIVVDVTNPFNDQHGLDMAIFPDGSSGSRANPATRA